jgi:hypothetical protein
MSIEKESTIKIQSVAVHGDFVNRELGVINNVITDDLSLRKEPGIKCEAYDSILMNLFDLYISDKPYPTYYSPVSPFQVLEDPDKKEHYLHDQSFKAVGDELDSKHHRYVGRVIKGIRW